MWLDDDAFLAAALSFASDGRDGMSDVAAFPPGRRAGLARLHEFTVGGYARGRNFAGERRSVSSLSPYLRHGLVTLVEARDHALATDAARAGKFVQELAWREYWRHVLDRRGRGVYDDIEEPKHAHHRAAGLPGELVDGETGLACVDEPLAELFETGYMHNHARMWVASATTHLFQRHHAPGAALFAEHLLDHDPASNSLSWQWVESSFAHRPYLYDRGNVEKWAPGMCARCPAGQAGRCPFDASYSELGRRLLGGEREVPPAGDGSYGPPEPEVRGVAEPGLGVGGPIVWLHASSLGAVDPALAVAPVDATVAIVIDAPHLQTVPHAAKRLAFIAGSALETAVDLRAAGRDVRLAVADPAEALLALDPGSVHVTDEPDPWIRESLARLRTASAEVVLARRVLLAPNSAGVPDRTLGRFSRWWKKAQREAYLPPQLSLEV
jgi:deoxyribodipyrimidine photo-lyase